MSLFFFFFFNDTATTEIYTLSLHDALPIWEGARDVIVPGQAFFIGQRPEQAEKRAAAQTRCGEARHALAAVRWEAVERGQAQLRPSHPRCSRIRPGEQQPVGEADEQEHRGKSRQVALVEVELAPQQVKRGQEEPI